MSKFLQLFIICALLCSCGKFDVEAPKEIEKDEQEDENNADENDNTPGDPGRSVRFVLNNFNSTKPDFRDTALSALGILSQVFSSSEFRDSVSKYSFPCTNGRRTPCTASPQLAAAKCDVLSNTVLGSTVYGDLLADSIRQISLHIRTHAESTTSTFGYAYGCGYNIYTYDWWLNDNRSLPLDQEYAVHLAHEYSHVVGYIHSSHPRSEDVAYKVGGIVRNILNRWTGRYDIPNEPLHTLFGQTGYKYMRIRVPELGDLSPEFRAAYNASLNQYKAIGQDISYLYLYFDPVNYKANNVVRVYLRGLNDNNRYFLIWFEYIMRVNDDGIATFEYTNNYNAIEANVVRTQPIRDYLTSRAFEVDFMRASAPANSILGGFTSLSNSNSFFYGVMLDDI